MARADLHHLIDVLPEEDLATARRMLEALAASRPEHVAGELPTAAEMVAMAQASGALSWLADEPDLYSLEDGEPVS